MAVVERVTAALALAHLKKLREVSKCWWALRGAAAEGDAGGGGCGRARAGGGTSMSVRRCRVAVVGGGVSGLAAADHLAAHGQRDFLLLEARSRIGGRVVAIPLGAQRVELGANWIHGVLGNPMFELAIANGLVDLINSPKPHRVIAATELGRQVPFDLLQEIYEAYVCFLKRCEEYFICQYLPPPDINSVGEHINLETALYLQKIPESDEKRMRRLIFECLLKRETCISGCHSMNEIDLLELGSYTELQGGNIVLPSGYSAILDPIMRRIPPENIIKSCPVKTIRWGTVTGSIQSPTDSGIDDPGNESDDSDKTVIDDSPNATPLEGGSKPLELPKHKHRPANVEIVCENGDVVHADHVICTLPLGVLKEQASTIFQPPLPKYKLESIDRLLYGTVDKIFLYYDRPFLNPTISEVLLLWEPHSDDTTDIPENWYRKIYSFSKVSDTILLGWISGKEAEYMETLPSETVSSKCTEILRKFLNDPFVPEPQKCVW